jgi:hypothetical protein
LSIFVWLKREAGRHGMALVHVCHIFPLSLSNLAQPESCSSPVSHTAALPPVTSKEPSFPHFSIKPSSVAGMPIFLNQLLCQGNLADSLPCLSRSLPMHAIDSFLFILTSLDRALRGNPISNTWRAWTRPPSLQAYRPPLHPISRQ